MSQPTSSIYILYNAKASLLGKLNYACRKITAGTEDSPCAACDLTHGGLKLDESAEWKQTKKQIGGATVKQLHKDELTPEVSTDSMFREIVILICLLINRSANFSTPTVNAGP